MTVRGSKGAIACGHPETAAAAGEILADGGNAFDATLAAFCAATVVEPVFCSLGGGGFLLAQPAGEEPTLYDFFVQTPKRRRPLAETDFYPIEVDFGPTTQEFHIGLGSTATPGAVNGLFTVHRERASLPMTRIVEPAVRLAREGYCLREIDRFVFGVVGPILRATAASRAIFTSPEGNFPAPGGRLKRPALAATFEALAEDGVRSFYQGDLAQSLITMARDQGGHLTQDDLSGYRTLKREPLIRRYRNVSFVTNPPPSSGGLLIAFALDLLSRREVNTMAFGGVDYLQNLARIMAATDQARVETELFRLLEGKVADTAAQIFLDPDLLAVYGAQIMAAPKNNRGTTHISVIDQAGNAAALTLSNGEGCGVILNDSGIMLNNMLGEEDLNPAGFNSWPEDQRLSSMMAPSMARFDDGALATLGSGGSNRIRTAILQVLLHLVDYNHCLEEAVEAPRLHLERGKANAEQGFAADVQACLSEFADSVSLWQEKSLFFGGVHAALRAADGTLNAAGDPRRGGVGLIV